MKEKRHTEIFLNVSDCHVVCFAAHTHHRGVWHFKGEGKNRTWARKLREQRMCVVVSGGKEAMVLYILVPTSLVHGHVDPAPRPLQGAVAGLDMLACPHPLLFPSTIHQPTGIASSPPSGRKKQCLRPRQQSTCQPVATPPRSPPASCPSSIAPLTTASSSPSRTTCPKRRSKSFEVRKKVMMMMKGKRRQARLQACPPCSFVAIPTPTHTHRGGQGMHRLRQSTKADRVGAGAERRHHGPACGQRH